VIASLAVKDCRTARECEFVLAFLRAESRRHVFSIPFQILLRCTGLTLTGLIQSADLSNDYQNALRAIALEECCNRAYLRRDGVFRGFPNDVTWRLVELESRDLDSLRYVRSSEWLPRSNTGSPREVADRIAAGELTESNDTCVSIVKSYEERLQAGETLPELIVVRGEGDDLILIEGAHRTTAYFRRQWSKNIPAFVGSSPAMERWAFYWPESLRATT
jgi:hypothetical protein